MVRKSGVLHLLSEQLKGLFPKIYDAEADDLTDLLGDIGGYLRGSAVALASHNFLWNRGFIHSSDGYNPQFVRSYNVQYARRNPWLADESDYRPPGKIHIGEHLVAEAELTETEFYTDWLEPQNLHHRLCAVLSRDRATAVFLEVMRPREQNRFDQGDIEYCRVVLVHLQRMLRMHQRIAQLETERDAALHALDCLPWGVVLVDSNGDRLAANRPAEALLLRGDGLMTYGDTLRATLPDQAARLDRLVGSVLNGTSTGGALSIARLSEGDPLSVLVIPLRNKPQLADDRGQVAAIFVSDPNMLVEGNEHHLRELYGLTAVEARLATWLLRGKSVDEAAAAMGVTVNTARTYLKRIFNKTGVRRQPALMRLLLLGLIRLCEGPDTVLE
jgi:DNA-binding CsgD family transcriptional regulator/PAS domain-containing protein